MIRTVALLGLVASASALFGLFEKNKPWNAGLHAKFDINPLTWRKSSFFDVPRSSAEAQKADWKKETRPARSYSSGYDSLVLWVNPKDYTLGILVDENEHTSGLQISIPDEGLEAYYDLEEQGYVPWIFTNATGVETKRWATSLFFASEDAETRSATYDETKVLQTSNIVVDGLNGKPYEIATVLSNLDNVWKKEACVPFMGLHYYFNMTETLSCDEPLFTWFPLFDEKTGQLIGLGYTFFPRNFAIQSDTLESPTEANVKMIVPTAPACMLEMVKTGSVRTLHIYFIDRPWLIKC